jgi:hypothetical protein
VNDATDNKVTARGTSEPGPFGVIVGDPLVDNVGKMATGSRGYAVQVQSLDLWIQFSY